ncbi:MAG: class I SAM-dependent methyltransferase [Chroococcidiopsis sp.]
MLEQGYQPTLPSVWLLEGLLMYLTEPQVRQLLETISQLATADSYLGLDLVNVKSIEEDIAPILTQYLGESRPAVSGIGVASLASKETLVEIEATAALT